ncbi:sperm flagellar protein 1-like [Ylistrum balloti]|uniref:sperm flagellar protein 1-like n=1 Tax=Ylistrum balloti TaxID=509963 RepID=UPI002905E7B8|nr:sperm flagellar protein 1-like [Ylistrum balloti]
MTTITLRKNLNGMNTIGMEDYVDETEIASVVAWINDLPLSRPKRNIAKDFEDGVLVAEVIKFYFPKMVDLHNYKTVSSTKQKRDNWSLLNRRVLKRLGMDLSDDVIRALANAENHVIERILIILRMQIDNLLTRQGRSRREVDLEFMNSKQQSENEKTPIVKDVTSPKENSKHAKDPNSQALVPMGAKSTGRTSPSKSPRKSQAKGDNSYTNRPVLEPLALPSERSSQVKSPRRIYLKGEIPHNHPDRSTYFSDKRLIPDVLPYYPYWYSPTANVPRSVMEEMKLEIMQKDATIKMLNSRIQSLESLSGLKQARIEKLQAEVNDFTRVYYVTDDRKIVR